MLASRFTQCSIFRRCLLLIRLTVPIMGQGAGIAAVRNDKSRRPNWEVEMQAKKGSRLLSRRYAFATMAGGGSLMAAPAIVRAPTPLAGTIVQQRGLVYLPPDMMVTRRGLPPEGTQLRLRQDEATPRAFSGAAAVTD